MESTYYSLSWTDTSKLGRDKGWQFSRRFSAQPELLEYAKWVSENFDLRQEIRFQTLVNSATWDEGAKRWIVHTSW